MPQIGKLVLQAWLQMILGSKVGPGANPNKLFKFVTGDDIPCGLSAAFEAEAGCLEDTVFCLQPGTVLTNDQEIPLVSISACVTLSKKTQYICLKYDLQHGVLLRSASLAPFLNFLHP